MEVVTTPTDTPFREESRTNRGPRIDLQTPPILHLKMHKGTATDQWTGDAKPADDPTSFEKPEVEHRTYRHEPVADSLGSQDQARGAARSYIQNKWPTDPVLHRVRKIHSLITCTNRTPFSRLDKRSKT